jgi:outer membrane protein OmpA-like peptidoglycan-associated protein
VQEDPSPAAFSDESNDPELALALTQAQAEAVRKYLVANHQIDSSGWFATHKIAAVGFGTETPRTQAAPAGGPHPGPVPPARRVEIILFTPQT